MGVASDIEWTDATWNPVRGCALVSPGCANCYAMKFAHRFSGPGGRYEGLTRLGKHGPVWTGQLRLVPGQLADPLRWKKGRRIFVSSMSDLFHEDVRDEYIAAVFGVMAACPQHTFQVLTKRAERMAQWFCWIAAASQDSTRRGGPSAPYLCAIAAKEIASLRHDHRLNLPPLKPWPLPNVWLMVSVENQEQTKRIEQLLRCPAAVRGVSAEPLLEAIDLSKWLDYRTHRKCTACLAIGPDGERCSRCNRAGDCGPALDWLIAGGESGHGARPMHPDWARSLRDQCVDAGVAFHFKQWGQWSEIEYDRESPPGHRRGERYLNAAGGHGFHGESVIRIRVGHKKTNGRLLDGRTWDEFPKTEAK